MRGEPLIPFYFENEEEVNKVRADIEALRKAHKGGPRSFYGAYVWLDALDTALHSLQNSLNRDDE